MIWPKKRHSEQQKLADKHAQPFETSTISIVDSFNRKRQKVKHKPTPKKRK